jgi:hypothetical protein
MPCSPARAFVSCAPRYGHPSERNRRTMDWNCPPRTARPATDHQPPPPHGSADRVRRALQRPSPAPRAGPSSTTEVTTTTCIAIPASAPTARSGRRGDTRIRPGRMTWMTSSAPTGRRGQTLRAINSFSHVNHPNIDIRHGDSSITLYRAKTRCTCNDLGFTHST